MSFDKCGHVKKKVSTGLYYMQACKTPLLPPQELRGLSKFIPRSDVAVLRETAKTQEPHVSHYRLHLTRSMLKFLTEKLEKD